jgi:hypothetical protein
MGTCLKVQHPEPIIFMLENILNTLIFVFKMYVIFLKPYLGTRKKLKIELEKQITPTSFKNNLHRLFLK